MKFRRKILGIGAGMLATGMLIVPALPTMADNTFSYTPITGEAATSDDAFSFDKDFVMNKDACIPAATFSYAIAPGAAVNPTATTAGVIPGPTGATIADVVYSTNEQASANMTIDVSGDTKTATKKATVDMSSCSFSEPGVYRYVITESGTNNGVTNDSQLKRTLDVYVEDSGSGVLQIAGYVFYAGEKTDAPSKTATQATGKSEGYTNTYDSYDLTFGKEVKGNFGSRDQYFEYTVTLDVPEGTVLSVDISDADATPHDSDSTTVTTAANPTTLTAGANGITQKFYIHDGQYITIKEIPANAAYTVSENNEDYTKTDGIVAADNDEGVAHTDAQSGTMTADVKTGFTNTRDTVTPTGVFTPGVTTGIVVMTGAAVGLGTFIAVRKRRASQD